MLQEQKADLYSLYISATPCSLVQIQSRTKAYEKIFSRLKTIGFDGDGAPNGIFLPGSQSLAKTLGLPGHWSSHRLYTEAVNRKLTDLNRVFLAGRLTDTQLALGIGKIQSFAREGLESGKFVIDQVTSRLL